MICTYLRTSVNILMEIKHASIHIHVGMATFMTSKYYPPVKLKTYSGLSLKSKSSRRRGASSGVEPDT